MLDNHSFCLIVEPYYHATSKSAKIAFIVWISRKNWMILRTYRYGKIRTENVQYKYVYRYTPIEHTN